METYTTDAQFGFTITLETTPYEILDAMPGGSRFTFSLYAGGALSPTGSSGRWAYDFIKTDAGTIYSYATAVNCTNGDFYVYNSTTQTWAIK